MSTVAKKRVADKDNVTKYSSEGNFSITLLPSFLRSRKVSQSVLFLVMCGFQAALFLLIGLYLGGSRGCLKTQIESCDLENSAKDQHLIRPVIVNLEAHINRFNSSQWLERYKAAMLLGGCADAIAFKRGNWEFQTSGATVHKELQELGGIAHIKASKPAWIVSDDTVMHLATAEAIVEYESRNGGNLEGLYRILTKHYLKSFEDMNGRAPGPTCLGAADYLNPNHPKGYVIPFNDKGGGCGAAMRAMCIGMYYPNEAQLDDLIAVSIESGRMTHNHPTGYLGALASALFTHCAIQGYPLQSWGIKLIELLDKAWTYVEKQGRDVEKNRAAWSYFRNSWWEYLKVRGIIDGFSMPQFPDNFGVVERDTFYNSLSFSGWGGASGHDAPMIAYDALLGAGDNWFKLAHRAFFHGGDSDSTAIIAATCFGILYGYHGIPEINYKFLEYNGRLLEAGENIFNIVKHHFTK